MIQAVLADWGHTLFDTPGSVDFIVTWANANGRPLATHDAWQLWDGARLRSRNAAEIAKGRDKSPELHQSCWLDLWTDLDAQLPGIAAAIYDFETSAAGWAPYSDTPQVLQALADRDIPVVIVSDVAFDLRPILSHYGLHHLIHDYVLSGEHGTIKPELELFRIALASAGVSADAALMVGDNHLNDGAAIEAGIATVLLPPSKTGAPRGLGVIVDLIDAGSKSQSPPVTSDDDGFLREGSTDATEVQRYYDAMAASYDTTLASWSYQAPHSVAASVFQYGTGIEVVLDAGCGTGLAGSALRAAGFSGVLHGLDVSATSLAEADRRGIYDTLRTADLQTGLAFDDDVVDAVVCVGVLTYVPDVDACLREFSRVCRPGGLIVFTQRDDVWHQRNTAAVLNGLENEAVLTVLSVSEPSPYMPDHADLGDLLVRYVVCRVRAQPTQDT